MNSVPLLKPLPAALGKPSCSCGAGFGVPCGKQQKERNNFYADRQKMLSLAGMSLGLQLKLDSHFSCHKKDPKGLHVSKVLPSLAHSAHTPEDPASQPRAAQRKGLRGARARSCPASSLSSCCVGKSTFHPGPGHAPAPLCAAQTAGQDCVLCWAQRLGQGGQGRAGAIPPLTPGDTSGPQHNPRVLGEFTIAGVKGGTHGTRTHTRLAEKQIQEKCVQVPDPEPCSLSLTRAHSFPCHWSC